MSISDINTYGWIFLISLAVFLTGVLGWYLNRSMIELAARVDRDDDHAKYSYIQAWLLPKYRAGLGRWANEDFHASVDARAKNKFSQFFLLTMALGALTQIGLWVYLFNFTDGNVAFLNSAN